MAYALKRGFQSSARLMIQKTGSFGDIKIVNGANGLILEQSVLSQCDAIEAADPRVVRVTFQGGKLHVSHKDPTETEEVITAGLFTEKGTQVGSVYFHLASKPKLFPNRLGEELGFSTTWRRPGLEVEDSKDRRERRAAEASAKGDNASEGTLASK
ncbi:predicted protein [Histoplasma capsulatum var. duboisii H88]|uniref:Predicted protein n=2 Tax=Ajellomyces capsulatus TaxID=5037 RepID=F0UJ32_AJEC8|nr:predicted protein [Histoplasma capsulatum H143]EGC45681.1 predicted protein [Histoplasma capsulatum var. duboisii H88]QSS56333.1 hypothetical protein I7I53_04517 [Histoplasma capsulatum var. duboisii H88]